MSDAWVDLAYSVGVERGQHGLHGTLHEFFGGHLSTCAACLMHEHDLELGRRLRASRPFRVYRVADGPDGHEDAQGVPAKVPRANAPASFGKLILFLYV